LVVDCEVKCLKSRELPKSAFSPSTGNLPPPKPYRTKAGSGLRLSAKENKERLKNRSKQEPSSVESKEVER